MLSMRSILRFLTVRHARNHGLAMVALAAALVSVVPAATYRCNYGMAEAGPICPSCHGALASTGSGEPTIDRGPCCSSEVFAGQAASTPRDQSRDVMTMSRADGSFPDVVKPSPALSFAHPGSGLRLLTRSSAPSGAPFILRL